VARLRSVIIVSFIALAIFLSGCASVEINHKIKTNGNSDIDITIIPNQENKDLFNQVKHLVFIDDSLKNKVKIKDNGDSVTYSFSDLSPDELKTILNELNKTKEAAMPFGLDSLKSSLNVMNSFNKDSFEFTREKTLSGNKFTYRIKTKPTAVLERINIYDEGNMLDPDSKNYIQSLMKNAYAKSRVEIIVITNNQITTNDYNGYRLKIIRDIKSRDKNSNYVFIFESNADDGACVIETNLWSSSILAKLDPIIKDFSQNCKDDRVKQIKTAVENIESLAENGDLRFYVGQSPVMINLTVEAFGKLGENNGEIVGKNKVRFLINPDEEREYYMTFEQPSFSLPSMGSMLIVAIIIVVIIVIVFLVLLLRKPRQQHEGKEHKAKVDHRLLEYVHKARKLGLKDDEIRHKLREYGWDHDEVDSALNK